MNKAVLISIQPKWCELIASGRKTIEVRKTKPKIPTPFKCYIYCTKSKDKIFWQNKLYRYIDDRSHNIFDKPLNGKIIGEFVCDAIITDRTFGHDPLFNAMSCMSDTEIAAYCTKNKMYGWHISDLKIYDKPKELSEFGLTRPPQSWCYVEFLDDEL